MFNFKHGEVVRFDISVADGERFSGRGIVIGVATTASAVIGVTYIVTPTYFDGNITIPSDTYPYTTVGISEVFLSKVHDNV